CGASSFDHLVGGNEQARWPGKTERLRGLKIEDCFVLGRRLYWKIDRLGTTQDTVDIRGGLPKHLNLVCPVGHETARRHKETERVDRRRAVPCSKLDDKIPMGDGRDIRRQEQTAVRYACEGLKNAFDVGGALARAGRHPHRAGGRRGVRGGAEGGRERAPWGGCPRSAREARG